MAPELVAAIAASIAALLSGLGLWLGGTRDERRWQRDALVSTVVEFLDASFDSPGDLSLSRFRAGRFGPADLARVRDAQQRALRALTRLRVIAQASVVEAAEEVHACDHAKARMLASTDVDEMKWRGLTDSRRSARSALLREIRRDLGLGPAKEIDYRRMEIFDLGQGNGTEN